MAAPKCKTEASCFASGTQRLRVVRELPDDIPPSPKQPGLKFRGLHSLAS